MGGVERGGTKAREEKKVFLPLPLPPPWLLLTKGESAAAAANAAAAAGLRLLALRRGLPRGPPPL